MHKSQHLIPTGIVYVGEFWGFLGCLLGELDTEYLCFSFRKQLRTYIDYKHIWLFHVMQEKRTQEKKEKYKK